MLKRLVDSYDKGKLIPKITFLANIALQEGDDIPPLEHHVKLTGTKFPFNSLPFCISPPGKSCLFGVASFVAILPSALLTTINSF